MMSHPSTRGFVLFTVLGAFVLSGHASVQSLADSRNPLLDSVKLRLYGSSVDDFGEYLLNSAADELLKDSRFDARRPTVFYYHGYNENPEIESVLTVITAFLGAGGYNAVLVDWSVIAAGVYFLNPLLLCPEVGKAVAIQLDAWHASGSLPISNVYLVGHSLGGQAAGFTGKHLTQAKAPRITALDPAYPGFNVESLNDTHLCASDALFVDVIHTDGGVNGAPYATGHVDFFPNGGHGIQPGCPIITSAFCSHWRSWRYFAESLNTTLTPYYGLACSSQADFEAGTCAGNETIVMGYFTPTSARGTFYLETADSAPFSLGEVGITSKGQKRLFSFF